MFNNAYGGANMATAILRLPTVKARYRAFPKHDLSAYFRGSLSKTRFAWRPRRRLDWGGGERLAEPADRGQPQGCAL